MQDTKNQENPSAILPQGYGLWYSSIAFLFLILGTSIVLYLLTQYTQRSIITTQAEIIEIDKDIQDINTNPNIVIAKIVKEN